MKKTLTILFGVLFFTVAPFSAQAQFLDKLSKKVEQKVENTIIDKTSKKAEKETGKAVDKVLEGDEKETKKKDKQKSGKSKNTQVIGGSTSSSPINANYDFTYNYQVKATSSEGVMTIDYYLNPKGDYIGTKVNQTGVDMFMIIQNNTMHMFVNSNGMKMHTAMDLDKGDYQDDNLSDYQITSLPDKKILGYNCKGTKMENNESEIIIYHTNEAPISFQDVFGKGSKQDNIPNSVREHFKDGALMMSMDYKDKTGKGKNNSSMSMECVKIEKVSFTFSTAGYQKY